MSLNKSFFIGNVGNQPEIRTFQNGNKIATFPIAINDRYMDKRTGEYVNKTEWINVKVIHNENIIKYVERYINKGDYLFIEGKIQTDEFITKQGEKGYKTYIIVDGFNSKISILNNENKLNDINNEL